MEILLLSLVVGTIFMTHLTLKNNQWIATSSLLKLICLGILTIGFSIVLASLLGNFYLLVILTTLVWASILQIRFQQRITHYNEQGN
ncbi:conserved membrane hypothetical protein [Carnobacterium maltaromaticum]|uniref:hypothetical protein n=1 Tax=Carnobacterium maltaromaticum TaxID=2751 RepID=UPI00191BA724|nr:hypothetical protein [Carnobacterium maltaromaticum]CAD5901623.1 conserved membrane hypothetical protein [Carnobacterium maltaromaticum]